MINKYLDKLLISFTFGVLSLYWDRHIRDTTSAESKDIIKVLDYIRNRLD